MSKQAWRVVGFTDDSWKIVGDDDVPILTVAYNDDDYEERRDHIQRIIKDHNALLNIPDPAAFMAAHRKLVEACEPVCEFNWQGRFGPMFDTLKQALAAVKEAS